jgi:hypothetical protein
MLALAGIRTRTASPSFFSGASACHTRIVEPSYHSEVFTMITKRDWVLVMLSEMRAYRSKVSAH